MAIFICIIIVFVVYIWLRGSYVKQKETQFFSQESLTVSKVSNQIAAMEQVYDKLMNSGNLNDVIKASFIRKLLDQAYTYLKDMDLKEASWHAKEAYDYYRQNGTYKF